MSKLPIDDDHPSQGEPLMDRDCVLLDGSCKCLKPFEDCKYISKEKKQDDAHSIR